MINPRWRNIAAVIAMYAIALQGVLALAVPVRGTAADLEIAALCQSQGTSGISHTNEPCAKCLAGHCAPAAGCGRVVSQIVWRSEHASRIDPVSVVTSAPARRAAQHSARAPPAA